MSSTQQATKMCLDARAAELKEKLLRSRSQNRASQASPAPSSIAQASSKPASLTPSRTSSTNSLVSSTSERTDARQMSAQPSFQADANDIAALISSISSASREEDVDGLSIDIGKHSALQNTHTQKSSSANGQPSLPSTPAKLSFSIPPKPSVLAKDRKIQQSLRQAELESTPYTGQAIANCSSDLAALQKNSRMLSNSDNSGGHASKNSDSAVTVYKTEEETACAAMLGGRWESPQEDPHITHANITDIDTIKVSAIAAAVSDIESGAESANNSTGIANYSNLIQSARSATIIAQETGHLQPDSAFTQLLAINPDVKDWLELTGYYDIDMRRRKLERFRKIKTLAAEKMRIEEEERRLLQEEELEMTAHRPTVTRIVSTVHGVPGLSTENPVAGFPTPITPGVPAEPKETLAMPPPSFTPAKRALEDRREETRKDKVARVANDTTPSESTTIVHENKDNEVSDRRRDSHSMKVEPRDSSPHRRPRSVTPHRDYYRSGSSRARESSRPRAHSRARDYSPRRSARQSSRYRTEHGDYDRSRDHPRRYDRYDPSYQQVQTYPIRVDLGRKGDTRFFIVKSFNEENVRRCMEDGIWTTQVQNGEILSDAFSKCKNVILFFSINKSRAFQGYARMASAPSPDTPRPKWMSGLHWDSTHPFRVQWLSKTPVEFWRIGNIKNPYNENLPVLVGKDGQELEEECGRSLLREMEAVAVSRGDPSLHHHESTNYGHYGSYGSYGSHSHSHSHRGWYSNSSSSRRHIKRELSLDRR